MQARSEAIPSVTTVRMLSYNTSLGTSPKKERARSWQPSSVSSRSSVTDSTPD